MIPLDKSKNTTIDCYLMRDPSLSMKETDLKKIESQYKYVCKIDGGSVFFCKIPNPVIITSSNILNEEYIIKNKKIFLKLYENKEKVIELDTTRKIYINKLYDTTIIDIKNEDGISEFFELDENLSKINSENYYENQTIYTPLWDEEGNKIEYGIFEKLKNNKIYFAGENDYKNSQKLLGAPVLNLKSKKVIGINILNNEKKNVCILLKYIIKDYIYFKNKNKCFINLNDLYNKNKIKIINNNENENNIPKENIIKNNDKNNVVFKKIDSTNKIKNNNIKNKKYSKDKVKDENKSIIFSKNYDNKKNQIEVNKSYNIINNKTEKESLKYDNNNIKKKNISSSEKQEKNRINKLDDDDDDDNYNLFKNNNEIDFKININFLNKEKINIICNDNDDILSIKNKINKIKGFPVKNQKLYLSSKLLNDSDKIKDVGGKNNKLLELYLTLNEIKIKFKAPHDDKCFEITISNSTKIEEILQEIYRNTYTFPEFLLLFYSKNLSLELQNPELIPLQEDSINLFSSLMINKKITKEKISERINDYFNDFNSKHRISNFKQLPLYISQEENENDYNLNCSQKIMKNCLPIIVINKSEYDNFIKILPTFRKYSKFYNNNILIEELIISSKDFNKINHINKYDELFFAECKNSIDIYSNKDIDKLILKIKKQLDKEINLNEYFEEWVRLLFNLMSEYILFILKKKPLYYYCKNCKMPSLYLHINSINKSYKNKLINKNAKKDNISIIFSLGIINLLIDYMFFDKDIYIKNKKFINDLLSKKSYGKQKNKNKIHAPPRRFPRSTIKGNNINIIYYNENININIPSEANFFERIIPNGVLILARNRQKLNFVLDEIKKNNNQNTNYNFHLIITGSIYNELMDSLTNEDKDIFKSGCIFSIEYDKYKNLKSDFIKGVYSENDEVLCYINEYKNNSDIFKTYKLVNYNNYIDKYHSFHKIISEEYNEENLNDENRYINAVDLLKDITSLDNNSIEGLQNILLSLKDENDDSLTRRNLIREYTGDSFYQIFNKWLNEFDKLAYNKISFIISSMMYGLNEEINFDLKSNKILYRGLKISYINLSFYERNINNIITFPSFISTSGNKDIAECFCGRRRMVGYDGYFIPIEERKSHNKFSLLIIIDYKYNNNLKSTAFSLNDLSDNPQEDEYLFLPFSFFKIKNVEINFDNYEANVYMENIGRQNILEKSIKNGHIIEYNERLNIMQESQEQEYDNEINKIIERDYGYLKEHVN